MITIEDFKNNITKKSRLLGLDLGKKRIGIAICDDKQSVATPFKTINKESPTKLIYELKLIIKENNIEGIVVGNPINMDGSLGPSSQSIKDICINIVKNIIELHGGSIIPSNYQNDGKKGARIEVLLPIFK